jgi:hypothetical protein
LFLSERTRILAIAAMHKEVDMPANDPFADLSKSKEGDYFRETDQELIEKLARRAELAAERQRLIQVTGVTDPEILEGLQELGFTYQTFRLLYLVPLVQVGWIGGRVTEQEREHTLSYALLLGVTGVSPAYQQLRHWLDHRPSDEFFRKTLRLIRRMLKAMPPKQQKLREHELMSNCTRVAEASGGILGLFSTIPRAEQRVLKQIAAELEIDIRAVAT